MIRRRASDILIVLISTFIYSLLIVFWPGQLHGGQLNMALACMVHAILYNLLAYNFSTYCRNPSFLKTPFAISCLILIAYLGVPFLKYYGEARYVEFDVGLHYRLLALLVVCASIFIMLKIYSRKWILFYLKSHETMRRSVGPLIVPFMYSIFGASTFSVISWNIVAAEDLSAAQMIFASAGFFISLYYFSFFGVQHKTLWNELLLISGGLCITYYSGSRSALLLAVLMVVFGRVSRIQSHQKRKSMVHLSLISIPLVIIVILVPLTELTKERSRGVDFYFEIQRTDFMDFVGAASAAEYHENVFTGLHKSLLWAVPGSYIDKSRLDYSMEPFFENNRWRSSDYREGYTLYNIDYSDSIFACGAMVGGFVGALLFPLAWLGVFSMVLSWFKNTLLLSFYLASIPSMISVEIPFWRLMPNLRTWFMLAIIIFVFIHLFSFLYSKVERKLPTL